MLRTEVLVRDLPELRLVKPGWQEALRREISCRREEVMPGRRGYTVRREIVDKIWDESMTVEKLIERRQEVKEFLSANANESERLLGRSYLGRIHYRLRRKICQSGAVGESARELRGAAKIFSATKGISLENFDYQSLVEKMAFLPEREPVEVESLEVLMAEDNQKTEKRLHDRFLALGFNFPHINLPRIKNKAVVLAVPVIMALSGLGFLIGSRIARHTSAQQFSEPPKAQTVIPPGSQSEVFAPPVTILPEIQKEAVPTATPVAFNRGVEAGVLAEKDLSQTGSLQIFPEKSIEKTKEKIKIEIGERIIIGGEIFNNCFFEQKVVLPKADGNFASNEMCVGAYSFDNEDKTTIWAIHSGWAGGQILPGQLLLENADNIGRKMEIIVGNNKTSREYVGSFILPKEEYSFNEESIVKEASLYGYDLRVRKYLALITCSKSTPEAESYDEVRVLLFLPAAPAAAAKTASG